MTFSRVDCKTLSSPNGLLWDVVWICGTQSLRVFLFVQKGSQKAPRAYERLASERSIGFENRCDGYSSHRVPSLPL